MLEDMDRNECCCNSSCCSNRNGNSAQPKDVFAVTQNHWVTGLIATPVGMIPQVASHWIAKDIFGAWKTRWGIGRMEYKVNPGLYAVGNPDQNSPVFVSANYKLSFDHLRKRLKKVNAWILVIDTKGINVWCAAGKGTFGTNEIVNRIAAIRLAEVVSHRTIILPQLGAPGVAAHEVKKLSGFKVVYGPVRASDLPRYIQAGFQATTKMRQVKFNFWNRLVLTPLELVNIKYPLLIGFLILFIINLMGTGLGEFFKALYRTAVDFIPYLGAVLAGAVLTPLLLPLIPVREFAWKGWIVGFLWTGFYIWYFAAMISWKQGVVHALILPPIAAFLAMNFTGSSTYTSLSGVVKEMGVAIPAMLGSVGLGVVFLVVKLVFKF